MPKCKNCKKNITKFDKQICPWCGEINPISGDNYQTTDITETIETIEFENKDEFKRKNKTNYILLSILLGIFGIDQLYLGFKGRFLIKLSINGFIYIMCLFMFKNFIHNISLLFLLPLLILLILNIIYCFISSFLMNLKDVNGVLLK